MQKHSLRSIMWCVYLCLLLVLLKKSVYMHLRSIGYVGGVHRRRHIGFVRYLVYPKSIKSVQMGNLEKKC